MYPAVSGAEVCVCGETRLAAVFFCSLSQMLSFLALSSLQTWLGAQVTHTDLFLRREETLWPETSLSFISADVSGRRPLHRTQTAAQQCLWPLYLPTW